MDFWLNSQIFIFRCFHVVQQRSADQRDEELDPDLHPLGHLPLLNRAIHCQSQTGSNHSGGISIFKFSYFQFSVRFHNPMTSSIDI